MLKRTLGNLADPEDEARYQRTMEEVLTEIVDQMADILGKDTSRDALLSRMEGEGLALMFDEIMP